MTSLALPLLVGAVGGFSTAGSVREWYPVLEKPWFTPPPWVFGPTWTLLYVLMGVALFLVWSRGASTPGVRPALTLFAVQLLLNALWSPVFFGLRAPGAALVVILALDGAVAATMISFFRQSRLAGALLVPYQAWVLFATLLNLEIWRLNG